MLGFERAYHSRGSNEMGRGIENCEICRRISYYGSRGQLYRSSYWRRTFSRLPVRSRFRKCRARSAPSAIRRRASGQRCIDEATAIMEASGETWCQAEINRITGEIALLSPEQDASKAQSYFERALTVARQQDAKSWELRARGSLRRSSRACCSLPWSRQRDASFRSRVSKPSVMKALLEELAV